MPDRDARIRPGDFVIAMAGGATVGWALSWLIAWAMGWTW